MSYRDRIEESLESVGRALGVRLSMDRQGVAVLRFADACRCWLQVSNSDERVSLYAPVSGVDVNTRAALFEAALRLNSDSNATGGGGLGYSQHDNELVLAAVIEGEVGPEKLAEALNAFMRLALQIRERLGEAARSSSAAAQDRISDDGQRPGWTIRV